MSSSASFSLEAEVIEGLEEIAREEIIARFADNVTIEGQGRGAVRFTYRGELTDLQKLRTIQAVYLVAFHAIPRPKALLGDQYFRVVINQINTIRALKTPKDSFNTLYISAAGSETAVMQRIARELSNATNLRLGDEKGDLWLRIRPSPTKNEGWETLVRLTPRPLATRNWRVCNFEGALNATVAQAMVQLASPVAQDRVLNLGCGSGSILIEQAANNPGKHLIGIDTSTQTLQCAETNINAANIQKQIQLIQGDIRQLPFPANSFDILLADLPFGQRIGSHQNNLTLYPDTLSEAARVITPGGRFVAITHEVSLIEQLLSDNQYWRLERKIRITLRGLHPRIYVLQRRS